MTPQIFTPEELLARLVAFDTTSHKTNLPLIDFVRGYLESHGVASILVPNEDGDKASLFATIGPGGVGGIGLSGHTDVVPVTDQVWDTDPFTLTKCDGRLYGRGTTDMKGFVACVLAAVPDFVTAPLRIPIHLLLSYDEEVGCTGVRPMTQELGHSLAKPRAVIVGEPTNMRVVDSHKSIHAFKTTVIGQEAHSSMTHQGANAVMAAAELICELSRAAAELKTRPGGERFDPPYSTVHVGAVEGGGARNIVPKHCEFYWELRALPGHNGDEIATRLATYAEKAVLPRLRQVASDAAIHTEQYNDVPEFGAFAGDEAISLALKLAGQNETFAVSYGTEAGLFDKVGCPSVICGPGDIAQAHKPNEFIAESELRACMDFLARLIERAQTSAGL